MQTKGKWSCPRATAHGASAAFGTPGILMTEDLEPPRNEITFTIFTPTYNRADTLERLFHSIRLQDRDDFEWLIVDDGSNDGTDQLVNSFAQAASFPVRYIFQSNAGKYIAFNQGVRQARGQLFLTIDSDDELTPDALALLHAAWLDIPATERRHFTGVTARCIDQDGRIVGSERLPSPLDTDSASATFMMKMSGERIGFHRIDVLRDHLFPEDVPTRFIPEGRVWLDIARHYKTRFIEQPARVFHDHREERLSGLDRVARARGDAEYYHFALNHYAQWWFKAPKEVAKLAIGLRRAELHLNVRADRTRFSATARIMAGLASPVALLAYMRDMHIRYGALGTRLLISRQLLSGKVGSRLSDLLMPHQASGLNRDIMAHAGGVMVELDATDRSNRQVLFSPGTAKSHLLRYYARHAKNFRSVAVLGQNISYVACQIALIGSSDASVLAIETDPAQTDRTRRSARASYANGLRGVTQTRPDRTLLEGCDVVHFQDENTALIWQEAVATTPGIAVITLEFDAPSLTLKDSHLLAGFVLAFSAPGEFSAWERMGANPTQQDSA